MPTDGTDYELTENMERWSDDDLIKYAQDTDVMMGLQKYQIVHIAQELAWRYDDVAASGVASEFND